MATTVRRWPVRVAWSVGVVLAFLVGVAAGAGSRAPEPVGTHDAATRQTVSEPPTVPQPVGPADTMTSGTYQVGVDVQPGRYKTPGAAHCYWARRSDDSGTLESIIANDNLTGPGSVTINVGEFIELAGACTWTKVA